MNIACIACPARYAISDAKIVGRKVRIGCKRCGTKLVIDGTTDPPSIRADTGVPSNPPAQPYHLAISHDQRERGDIKRIVELYGRGGITANTLAWREGMSQWQSLFEVEEIAKALQAAGYSVRQGALPSYDEEQDIETRAGAYGEDEEPTHVAKSPLEDRQGPPPRFDDDEDEATHVFDTDALHQGAGWSEPASWRNPASARPLVSGWRERGQSPLPPRTSSKPPGGWSERGLEDDEVTRMVAPLDEQPERFREPMFSGPGFELRRPKTSRPPSAPPASEKPQPLSIKPSARPPSLPPEDAARMTGQRSEDSVLFTLERLTKQKPPAAPAQERAQLDFSDVAPMSLAAPVAAGTLGSDLPALAAPAAKLKLPPPAAPAPRADEVAQTEPRRSSKWRVFAVLVLLVGAGLGALYATGRWPLVTKTAASLWQRVQNVR